ncbi:MAG: CoA-binding protein [Dehalococcoidales bacterium]|nr:CoA-binding protein [Dehalococcoidales bacterium]
MELDFARLDRAFNPRCIAVVGDKGRLPWVKGQLTFKGKLYSVQINPETAKAIEALGIKNYSSLLDIPEPIDLVIISVPRKIALQILEDCIRKQVAAAHFFTAGYSETDTEEGKRLEAQLVARAREANLYLIGPNCVGIFNPGLGVRQNPLEYSGVSGSVSFISQSGTHSIVFAAEGHFHGVDVNKAVSFGNGVVLDSPDFLEYFGQDESTKIITMYLEGVKDGRRFLSVLHRVAAKKPVIIWKGGRSRQGERAIASHTGSLAISHTVWEAAMRQCRAISVSSMDEMIDTAKALLYLSPVRGNRVGIAGGSGGQSVAISDVFAEAGLEVPRLSPESNKEISSFFKLVGASYSNPVDTGAANRTETRRILEIMDRDANIDNLVLMLTPITIMGLRTQQDIENDIGIMTEIRQKTQKPVMVVIPYYAYNPKDTEQLGEIIQRLLKAGVPAFINLERGARALKNALTYYLRRDTGH